MAHSHSIKENPAQVILIAGLAAAAGAATALLTAPKKGSDTRADIKARVQSLKHRNDRVFKSEKEKTQKIANRVMTIGSKVKEDTKSTSRHAKTAARDAKKDTKDLADEIRRNGEP